ncbi:CD276 antigen-like [Pygocentrus nattereri]|uniref:Ig-like domain-containing protein n=1 Tax=Pygocentrus nattereri TaxID=42514 RepID=A0A3B4CBS2_PYGNA|nr:CD276 antigen-like [Pygocentrus nattereri]
MLCLVSALCLVVRCAAFKVTAPAGRLVGVRGQPAVLGCEFTPDSNLDLSTLVVTWQRKEDDRVVHSFYYQQDQLDRQNADYHNRTLLFMTELVKGNASLRIEAVTAKDEGQYLCMVSNARGTDKALVQLEYGAFYTEPRLSISFNCSSITVHYEAEGFPKPEVKWLGDQGQNLTHQTEVTESPDGGSGLYHLKSSLVMQSPALNVTFILMNQRLNQHLQRPVSLAYGEISTRCGTSSPVIILSVLCFLLFASCMIFLLKILCNKKLWQSILPPYHPANSEFPLQRVSGG